MKIEVITPSLNEAGFGVEECNSMYEAHTNKIYNDANGWPSEIYVDGILQDHLPSDAIQPDTYKVKTFKQQEQCKCGQQKVGGYSCQRTDCNQNL